MREEDVQDMLGLLPHEHLMGLLQSVADNDGRRMLAIVEQMGQLTTDFTTAADSLIALLHSIAVQQVVATDEVDASVAALAQILSAADVQLYYQMALHGRRDLPLAPDPRSGFEMLLLRMLAFRLDDGKAVVASTPLPAEKKKILSEELPPFVPNSLPQEVVKEQVVAVSMPPPHVAEPFKAEVVPISTPSRAVEPTLEVVNDNTWHAILPQLALSGMALPLAQHCLLETVNDTQVTLLLDESGVNLQSQRAEAQLAQALAQHFGREITLQIKVTALNAETPEKRVLRESAEKQAEAITAINDDPFVQALQATFDAVVVPGSIRPRS